jgi:hypothetical protein
LEEKAGRREGVVASGRTWDVSECSRCLAWLGLIGKGTSRCQFSEGYSLAYAVFQLYIVYPTLPDLFSAGPSR